jgi:tetratricopeptide (TPR) repeat protein
MYVPLGGHRQVLKLKKVATVILLTFILSLTSVIFNPTLALTSEEQRAKAETLLNLLDTVNTNLVEAFRRLNTQNIPVPPNAETKYNEGIVHTKEAVSLMNTENYAEASSEAIKAMQNFKETLIILQEASPVEPTYTEATAEQVINLKANVTRAYEHAERLENITAKARAAGYNTTEIDNRLSAARNHLENVTRKLDRLDLDGASEELRSAITLLDEVKEYLNDLVNLVKIANTQRYLEETEKRINETKADVASSANLSPQNKTNAITALNNSETSLENARELLEEDKIDEAIGELEEAKRWEDESRIYLSSSVTATEVESKYNGFSNIGSTESQ